MQTRLPLRSHSRLANFLCYIQDPSSYTALPIFFQVALDKLTVDSAHQQASAAVAAASAADQQAGFDIRMAKAEHDAGGMKASLPVWRKGVRYN